MRKEKITRTRTLAAIFSILLILAFCAGTSLAFIADNTFIVANTFTPAYVTTKVEESVTNGVKSNVRIVNTGNTDAYVRAAVLVTWQNRSGDVYGTLPTVGEYSISFNTTDWIKAGDGFYYHKMSVSEGGKTEVLITKCELLDRPDELAEEYDLCVEIISSGIQAKGSADGKAVVESVWPVEVEENGELSVKEVRD